jgi:hypothetical protein
MWATCWNNRIGAIIARTERERRREVGVEVRDYREPAHMRPCRQVRSVVLFGFEECDLT